MPTASIYIRLSREAGTANLSLEGMLADVRALADRLGYQVVTERVDNGISGAVRDRPEFLAWLADAQTGAVDAMLTYHADRLTREGVNAAALILDTIEGKDPRTGRIVRTPVRLVDCHGLDSADTEAFRWRFVIAAEVARAERERIKSRNLATQRRLRETGRWRGGTPPYGTRVVETVDGKALAVDETEAAILREAGARLLRGDSMRAVVRWMNEQGCRTRWDKPWQRSSLRSTILSAGVREHVFDLATHDALRDRLTPSGTGVKPVGGRPQKYLLVGLIVCGICGRSMSTGGRRASYTCAASSTGLPCDRPMSIRIAATDAWVEAEYLSAFGRLEYLEPRVVVTGGEDLDKAARDLEAAREALLTSPGPEALAAYQEAMERHAEAEAAPKKRERVLVPTGKTIAELWAEIDVAGRADLLADALDGPIRVMPSNQRGIPRGHVDVAGRLVVPWRT